MIIADKAAPTRRALPELALMAVGWLTVLVGLVHLAATRSAYDHFGYDTLWFMGSGLAVVLIGALTLLARRHGGGDAVVRVVAIAANVGGLALGTMFGVLSQWSEPQGPVLITLFLIGALAASWGRSRAGSAR